MFKAAFYVISMFLGNTRFKTKLAVRQRMMASDWSVLVFLSII